MAVSAATKAATSRAIPKKVAPKKTVAKKTTNSVWNPYQPLNVGPHRLKAAPTHLLDHIVNTGSEDKHSGALVAIFTTTIPDDETQQVGTKTYGVEWYGLIWCSPQFSRVVKVRNLHKTTDVVSELITTAKLEKGLRDGKGVLPIEESVLGSVGTNQKVANLQLSQSAIKFDATIQQFNTTGKAPKQGLPKKRVVKKVVATPKPATAKKTVTFYEQDEFVAEWKRVVKERCKTRVESDVVDRVTLWYSPIKNHDDVDGLSAMFLVNTAGHTIVQFVSVDEDGEIVKKVWDGRPSEEAIATIDKYLFSLGQKG